jgi:hypothetical protein
MENNQLAEEPKKKTAKDFILLFLASGGLIVGLIMLKYAMGVFNIL